MNLRLFSVSCCLAACLLRPAAGRDPAQVIIILADSLGAGELSLSGNPAPGTPGIDALAKECVILANHHGGALTAPGRAMFFTGKHPWQAGVWGSSAGRDRLPGGTLTLQGILSAAGLHTSLFGTWGLGDAAPCRARDHGFIYSLTHGGAAPGSSADIWGNDGSDDLWLENGTPVKTKGTGMEAAFEAAGAYLEARRKDPFLCVIAPPASAAKREDQLKALDTAVAGFSRHLTALGLDRTALLLLTAATGPEAPGQGLRGSAGTPYENGHRVPCLIRKPGLTPRPVTDLTWHADLLPTLAGLTGTPLSPDLHPAGTDLSAILNGSGTLPERVIMVEAQDTPQPVPHRLTSVMEGRWRLVNGRELYDVQIDPAQRRNVAGDNAATVARLKAAYDAWWEKRPPLAPARLLAAHGEPVLLCPSDRTGTAHAAATQEEVVRGVAGNGPWQLQVPVEALCIITLHRWPPGVKAPDGVETPPPVKGILRTGNQEEWKAPDKAGLITFEKRLPAGLVSLDALWTGQEGTVSPVLYVEIRPKEEVRSAVPVPATPPAN